MDIQTKLTELQKRTLEHREVLLTEEAAKTALVMPFIQALGYDVFNPSEVVPEYTADVGTKKGEKVEVDIPVVLAGEAVSPAVAMVDLQSLTLSVDALKVPEQIEIDVEGKEEGYQLFAGDVVLPGDAELVTDAEILVVSVMVPRVAEEDLEPVADEDAEGAEGETEAEGAESSEGSEEE